MLNNVFNVNILQWYSSVIILNFRNGGRLSEVPREANSKDFALH